MIFFTHMHFDFVMPFFCRENRENAACWAVGQGGFFPITPSRARLGLQGSGGPPTRSLGPGGLILE